MRRDTFKTIDHVVPIAFGFKHDIDAELIGSRSNLQLMKLNENISKGQLITDRAIELLREWELDDLADAQLLRR